MPVILNILLSLLTPLWALSPAAMPQYRDPGQSYLAYKALARVMKLMAPSDQPQPPALMDLTKPGHIYRGETPPEWGDPQVLEERFQAVRDHRPLVDPEHNQFPRRLTWLYPDDGCYARAAMMVRDFYSQKVPLPKKVFVFGDLVVKTPNTPDGEVTWWYHVAPIVRVKGRSFVLDPAIEPRRALPLKAWLSRMSSSPQSLEVAICDSGAYVPGEDCNKPSDGVEAGGMADETNFLELEWDRLLDMKRIPERELGDEPPWNP